MNANRITFLLNVSLIGVYLILIIGAVAVAMQNPILALLIVLMSSINAYIAPIELFKPFWFVDEGDGILIVNDDDERYGILIVNDDHER